jgi:selenocysteine-specific elongation factor
MRSVVIGTAGHIDHGKSALVRALTGTDPDRLKEEQERGITIDLGFAHLRSGDTNLAFVDVPGHERFIKNMLAGAGGIDLVMLIVAADESVMPQTREHFHICRLLEVPAGLIVLTKIDLVDQETRDLVALEVRELTEGSFLGDAPIVPVSSKTGAGLDDLRSALLRLAESVRSRDEERPLRLPVDRAFIVKGFGTVVTGTLVAGAIHPDEEVTVLPDDRRAKVRGLQVHGQSAAVGRAGQRVAVNLGGIEVTEVSRGDTLAEPGSLDPTRRADVSLDLLPDAAPLGHGARVRFHHGTTEVLARVALAGSRRGDGSLAQADPGSSVYARLRLESAAVLTRGDRFIVRAYSPAITLGGGSVLDPQPPRGAIRTEAGRARFRRIDLEHADDAAAVLAFIEERGAAGLEARVLASRVGLAPAEAAQTIEMLVDRQKVIAMDGVLIAHGIVAALSSALLEAIAQRHRDHPLAEGLPREEARERIFGRAAAPAFDYVIERLVSAGRIAAREHLALAGHQVSLTAEEATASDTLERVFREAGVAPPDASAVAMSSGLARDTTDRIVKLLIRRGRLVKLEGLLFHVDALADLRAHVQQLKLSGTTTVDVGAFKERYGISRKYAIPLLEYLDRERVTRRAGDSRIIL